MRNLLILFLACLFLNSCTFQTTFNLKSDNTGSFVASLKPDKTLSALKEQQKSPELPVEWTSLYDYMKAKNDSVTGMPEDSIKKMKKIFIRGLENNGMEIKMDSIAPAEWNLFNSILNYTGQKISVDKTSPGLGMNENPFTWDGSTLLINMKDYSSEALRNSENKELKKTLSGSKKENAEMLAFMKKMFGDAKMEIIYRFVLDKKIKRVKGKNQFVKQIDDRTIEMRIDVMELLEIIASEKKIKHKDELIYIYTK